MSQMAAANVIADAVGGYVRSKRARTNSSRTRKRSNWKRGLVKTKLPSTYKFTRFVSTGQSGVTLTIGTTGTGLPSFTSGAVSSQTLQMDFALDAYRVYLGGLQIAAVAVPGYNEFALLFDKFRIEAVELYYTNSAMASISTGAPAGFQMPGIVYVVDTDDANSTTAADLQQFAVAKYTQLAGDQAGMKLLAKFKPKPSLAVYDTPTNVGGVADLAGKNLWLDCGTPDIRHYGFKMAIDQLALNTQLSSVYTQINFQVRYRLSFKDVR